MVVLHSNCSESKVIYKRISLGQNKGSTYEYQDTGEVAAQPRAQEVFQEALPPTVAHVQGSDPGHEVKDTCITPPRNHGRKTSGALCPFASSTGPDVLVSSSTVGSHAASGPAGFGCSEGRTAVPSP